MWQLYQFPLCPFSRKIRLLLGEKGVGYVLVRESPWERRDEFVDLNPAGRTPVMVDQARGQVLMDSMAIAEYFEETVEGKAMINGTAASRAEDIGGDRAGEGQLQPARRCQFKPGGHAFIHGIAAGREARECIRAVEAQLLGVEQRCTEGGLAPEGQRRRHARPACGRCEGEAEFCETGGGAIARRRWIFDFGEEVGKFGQAL